MTCDATFVLTSYEVECMGVKDKLIYRVVVEVVVVVVVVVESSSKSNM